MSQPYVQTTDLQALIDWETIMPLPRYAGGHDEQMKLLFKGAVLIAHWNEGDYQGKVATLVRLPDGRAALYNDYYGSCSGCDSWEGADDATVRAMCIDLANGAYVFPDPGKALAWVERTMSGEKADRYSWDQQAATGIVNGALDGIPKEAKDGILEKAGDGAPKLVFADWLDERGESDRAAVFRQWGEANAA